MLGAVLSAAGGARTVRQLIVVSPDRDTVPAEIPVLADTGECLNSALTQAHQVLREFGCREVVILPADLPNITAAEIDSLVRAGRSGGFAIAPDAAGVGTNALCLVSPHLFRFQFGFGSRRLHIQEAERTGLTPRVIHLPGLEFDVDSPADLERLDEQRWPRASGLSALLRAAESGPGLGRVDSAEALEALVAVQAAELLPIAESLTLAGFGETVTYSRKVFIPLTQLCRDVCHYCTFAKAPRRLKSAYLAAEEVLAIARAGQAADCKEALFTLGDKPEDAIRGGPYGAGRGGCGQHPGVSGAHGQARAGANGAVASSESRSHGRR